MIYRLLADLVLIVHAAFVAFVMLGGLAVLRWPPLAWLHLPVVLWGAGIEFMGGICPLTPLENRWRELAGDRDTRVVSSSTTSWRCCTRTASTRSIQVALGLLVVVVNLAIYAYAWRRRRPLSRRA